MYIVSSKNMLMVQRMVTPRRPCSIFSGHWVQARLIFHTWSPSKGNGLPVLHFFLRHFSLWKRWYYQARRLTCRTNNKSLKTSTSRHISIGRICTQTQGVGVVCCVCLRLLSKSPQWPIHWELPPGTAWTPRSHRVLATLQDHAIHLPAPSEALSLAT